VSADDRRAVELILGAGLTAEVWGFSRAVEADVKVLVELGLRASVIESPISELKLEALGVDREAMLERIVYAVAFAAEQGLTVAFFGVDGTRADLGYFETVYKTAVEAGAKEVVVVDTIGVAAPEAVAELVDRTREWVGPDVPVHFHGHNDFGVATAAAVAAARAGARWIQGTINGMGERAGNANLAEIALALRGLYGVETNLRLDRVRAFSERLRALSGYELEPYKPLVGENLFTRESGAVASQFHDPPAIEPYSSELVSAERRIVLGKKSGIDSIRIKAEELGVDLDDEQERALLAEVKRRGTEKRGLVTDDEFRELAGG
jgi:isopropylmalate/homocitrate/citramalate synthase